MCDDQEHGGARARPAYVRWPGRLAAMMVIFLVILLNRGRGGPVPRPGSPSPGCPDALGTATCSRPPPSPPEQAAEPQQPSSRSLSRTAAPEHTGQECPRHDVTPGAAPIAAAPAGPLAGTGPPNPAHPAGQDTESLVPTTRNR